jgi:3-hydroxyacyl-CoA dehydrogenase
MRLLEVVRGAETAPDVLATAMALARRIGKVGVVAGVCDGFIGNRMIARYAEAANDLLVLGASPRQIDGALQTFGFAMGPFRMGDLAGLDIGWASRKRRAAANPGHDMRVAADLVCEAGRFGQKTGAGWYRYEPGKRDPIADPIIDELIAKFRAQKGVTPRQDQRCRCRQTLCLCSGQRRRSDTRRGHCRTRFRHRCRLSHRVRLPTA